MYKNRVDLHDKPEPYYDYYMGRYNKYRELPQSQWANPYRMKNESDRQRVLNAYEDHIRNRPDLIKRLPELFDGEPILACWCPLIKECHIDRLYKLYKEFYG